MIKPSVTLSWNELLVEIMLTATSLFLTLSMAFCCLANCTTYSQYDYTRCWISRRIINNAKELRWYSEYQRARGMSRKNELQKYFLIESK